MKKLNNGLTLIETKTIYNTIHIALFIKVGSKHEISYPKGIAHFIEHMLFKGTINNDALSFQNRIDAIGGEFNAFTTKEYTCITVKSLKKFEQECLNLLKDMITSATLPLDEIKREKQVILEEIKMYEDDPEDLIYEIADSLLFSDSGYGHPILGTRQSLKVITYEHLRAFYERFYVPNEMILSYAGVDASLIESAFSSMNARNTNKEYHPFQYNSATYNEKKKFEQKHILYVYNAVSVHHRLYDAYSIVCLMFGETMSSPLVQTMREQLGLTYHTYSTMDNFENGGVFYIYLASHTTNVHRELQTIIQTFKKNMNDTMLCKAKEYMITNAYMGSDYVGDSVMRHGRSYMTYGEIMTIEQFEQRVQAITLENVNEVLQMLTSPSKIIFS